MRLIILILLLLTSCLNNKPSNTLRISFNTEPNTLDPQKAGDFTSSTLVCLMYEGLTRSHPDGKVSSALSERFTISEDETTYTFHIKKAYWSDGTLITAYDFETSWKRALSLPSLCIHLFYPIKNVEKWLNKEVSLDEVGIKALDEKTLLIELERPTPYFYELTAFPTFLAYKEPGIYNGPFILTKKKGQSEIILGKNPLYWDEKTIQLESIHIAIIPDEMTALHLFEEGELDWLGGPLSPLPIDALDKFKDQIVHIPSAGSTLCTFNTQRFPFNNKDLRKAFSYAIDREQIVREITLETQLPAMSMLPPLFSSQSESLFDPMKAREHYENAIHKIKDLGPLILYYRPGQMEKRLAQILQMQWEKTLGVNIQLVQLDFKTHTHKLHTKNYQIALASWIAQYNDPMSILERYVDPEGAKNYPGWENEDYNRQIRRQNSFEAERILKDEMPLTPIYHWSSPSLKGARVEQAVSSICGGILFEQFRINEP